MNCTDIESRPDCEFVYVHNAIVSVLARFLDPTVPWVWILGHCPNRHLQWWNTTVPLNDGGSIYTGAVRALSFDLQLSTRDFVSRATDFDEHGLALIQSHKRMPDTLSLDGIPESQQTNVLRQNGGTLRMYLPHAIETAQVQSFKKGYLETVIGT
ncbi:hypothetical protein [Gimesia algae]|uniref:Uncharacterized protein n=1 Tax=Gimesia algae TaxID=2527971 RepID=A0A517VCT8_9PLAN|nr:hypothetical protein [Gimesia algae]QDT90816.1 hypothetical protein Pan161_24700 [Gimesia algae]